MNSKDNICKAYAQFANNLQQDKDYLRFRADAYRLSFVDGKKVQTFYNVPNVYTPETRKLNQKLR